MDLRRAHFGLTRRQRDVVRVTGPIKDQGKERQCSCETHKIGTSSILSHEQETLAQFKGGIIRSSNQSEIDKSFKCTEAATFNTGAGPNLENLHASLQRRLSESN